MTPEHLHDAKVMRGHIEAQDVEIEKLEAEVLRWKATAERMKNLLVSVRPYTELVSPPLCCVIGEVIDEVEAEL